MVRPVTLNVSEVFSTVQGEGPLAGQPATFLRLAGCNLTCSWCDTGYAWDWSRYSRRAEVARLPVAQVAREFAGARLAVVTGGEPLLQRLALQALLWEPAFGAVPVVQFETNGTRPPEPLVEFSQTFFVVSPKLAHGGDPEDRRIVPGVLAQFGRLAQYGRACLKIVVRDPADVTAAVDLAARFGFPLETVWVLPEGATRDEHLTSLTAVADAAFKAGVNLSTRLHLLAWPGVRRGR